MKSRLQRYSKYVTYLASRLSLRLTWQRALRSTRSAIGYFNQVPIVLLGKNGRTWVLGSVAFAKYCISLKSHSGLKGLAISLKVSSTVIIKWRAGSPIKGTAGSLGHRIGLTRSGLPKWVPSAHRKAMLKGDLRVVRFWLSLCSLYRVIDFLGKPNLRTITSPGVCYNYMDMLKFVHTFFFMLRARSWISESSVQLKAWEPRLITKSGPGSVSPDARRQPVMKMGNTTSACVVQAITWFKPEFLPLRKKFEKLALLWGQESLWTSLRRTAEYAGPIKRLAPWAPEYLGKLGIKEEPGKVRVFAMVDWWTQMLLRPVHKCLFGILSKIPQDATFDQDAGVQRGVQMLRKSRFAASYDLSAATDRLPLFIQTQLINHLWPGSGQLWGELLTARSYSVPKRIRGLGMKIPKSVTYAVGQPMGALSSWAMLALTHHFIVQYSARKAGWKTWFPLYLVLGDDIVIFDRNVAAIYLDTMRALGVGINLVKSVVSTTSFEFAKRFYHLEENLSPCSFKELEVAQSSLDAMAMLFSKFLGDKVRIASFAKFRGHGYRTLGKLNRNVDSLNRHISFLLVYLAMPGITPVSFSRWIDWFGMTSIGHSKPVQAQSLMDVVKGWWTRSSPQGSTTTLTPRDIWGPTGIHKLKDWRVEMLESTLQSLLWPQQLAYMDAHRAADKRRAEVEKLLPKPDLEEIERFLKEFMEWDAENSLTPVHIDVFAHRDKDPVKVRTARWLRWWSSTRTSK